MKQYQIILNETQLVLLEKITDLYTRIGLLQYKEIFEHINDLEYNNAGNQFVLSHEIIDQLIKILRLEVDNKTNENMSLNGYRGINNTNVPNNCKIAVDIYQVLRFTRSWANAEHNPEERDQHFSKYLTVNYDTPHKYSNEPLIECKEIIIKNKKL